MNELCKTIAIEKGSELEQYMLARAAKNFRARADNEKFDLYPFYAILVTAGVTNKNLDAFDTWETYQARHSPLDKPVNLGHNQEIIRGHILDCVAVDENLKPLPEDLTKEDLPAKLHLVISAVIYKIWESPKVQAEVNSIIDKMAKGSTYVSMETLFRDFDFLLTNASTGEQRLIPRNEKTVGLTRHLRQYGGKGKLYNYTLARLLKQMTFSGVGVVDKPANEESVISASLDVFSSNASNQNESVYINLEVSKNGDNYMSEKISDVSLTVDEHPRYIALKSEFDSLAKAHDITLKDNKSTHDRLAEVKAELETVKASVVTTAKANDDEEAMAGLKSKLDEKEKEVASLRESIASLESSKASVEAEKAELATANDAMQATINEFKKASRHSDRAEALMKVDSTLTRENALQTVAKFDELSDSGFAAMIEVTKGFAARSPKEVTPESILATAKVEASPPLGAAAEDKFDKITADVKNFLTNKKGA